ncbi:uncharacterized protein DS421_19g645740 [Arachis hypogaea]|uniref:Uncharacterized protein n=1 Tax=Arachis hypogaea TaxID=3818 RepID=A0A6B9V5K6_ARAHY|nr:uncharacterized protein DS421_19g645740 [Arachis hypogaea]
MLREFMANLTEVMNHVVSLCSNIQDIPIVECGGLIEEHNEKENLELQGEGEELRQGVQQEEEVVEDLEDVECKEESQVEEPFFMEFENDVKEDSAQPPRHNVIEELEEVVQATSFPIYDDSASTCDPFELDGSFPIELGIDVEVDFSQTSIYNLSDGKEIEDNGEEACELEEAWREVEFEEPCQVVETPRRGWTGVEFALSRSLETPLPKLSSNPSFEWVKLLTLSFIIPLEFGLLETDGQLRALCGMKRKRRMFSGWHCKSRLIVVGSSNLRSKGWTSAQLDGSRRIIWCPSENSMCLPPKWNNDKQLEDGCENKIWDPGSQHEYQFWELIS